MDASAPAGRPARPTIYDGHLPAALSDLRGDFEELLHLCRSAEAELGGRQAELDGEALHAATAELLAVQLGSSRRRYRTIAERLLSLGERARCWSPTSALVAELAAEKAALADLLRTEQALSAALLCSAEWQSPSFCHAGLPANGGGAGRVRMHWNDYKRDRHLDAQALEQRYLEAMVDDSSGVRALLTSCGMAAFTTALAFLSGERRLEGSVLVGAGLYHESRLLLERRLPGRIRAVDEQDGVAFLRAIDELRPSAVFLDTLSNTRWMPVVDLPPVLERLAGTDTYLILDNTCLSVSCQPFAMAGSGVRLIAFESLLKYAQLGLDRANAGLLLASAEDASGLSDYREHLGTNIADVAVHALPCPSRRVLERRLARFQRNALILAQRLTERVGASIDVVYPGLPGHPSARAGMRLPFRGGCLSLVPRDEDPGLERGHLFVAEAVAEAAERGVGLLGGSSFGFDTSRVYVTAADRRCGEPFVRIAAGTEHRVEVELLADTLAAAAERVLA